MFKTLKNAWKIKELKDKLIFTLIIVILYRLGAQIPVPFISPDLLEGFNAQFGSSILGFMSVLSGGALSQATLFALSVSPYITSSIVVQLLTIALPFMERWAKDEGEEGKKKIDMFTRVLTVVLALITAYGYTMLLKNNYWLTRDDWFSQVIIIACFCAGASLIMWLAEKINEHGIGNGISMILFANIISGGPQMVGAIWDLITGRKHLAVGILFGVLTVAIMIGMILLIVWVTNSERRIQIQYAKRVVGRKMYGGQGTNLPIKLNMSGVMPIIFASSIVSILPTIASFLKEENKFKIFVDKWLGPTSWIYVIAYMILIVAFAYFYIMISFNPVEVANNIKSNGGSIPGIRTGRPTAEFITKILNKVTLIGAIFLCLVAGVPLIINIITKGLTASLAFGGSSMIIVVGVALETVRDIEAQMTLRNYKGFLD